jgi:hypothetical protein
LRYFNGWHSACLPQARLGRARRQWSLPADQQAEATRFPLPLPGANIGEQKAKVNSFFSIPYFSFCVYNSGQNRRMKSQELVNFVLAIAYLAAGLFGLLSQE